MILRDKAPGIKVKYYPEGETTKGQGIEIQAQCEIKPPLDPLESWAPLNQLNQNYMSLTRPISLSNCSTSTTGDVVK